MVEEAGMVEAAGMEEAAVVALATGANGAAAEAEPLIFAWEAQT